jgi:DinB family protein
VEAYVHDAVLDMRLARDGLIEALDRLSPDDYARRVPYRDRTVHDVLAHVAAADHVWALAAQGLLKGESDARPPLSPAEAAAARRRAIERGRASTVAALRDEMDQRRNLLLGLYELLERRHLAMKLATFGEAHNSVRERIWLGYHDRLHRADIDRAMRMVWHPPKLAFAPEVRPAVDALSPDETLYVVFNIDPVMWERPVRGLDWTHRQLLAHIATGDWVFQGHLRHIIETGAVAEWADIAAGNADRLEARKFSNDRTLIEEYLSMRHETLLLIARLKPQDLSHAITLWWLPEGERDRTILDYVLAFEQHDRTHRDQLRPAMKHATSTR